MENYPAEETMIEYIYGETSFAVIWALLLLKNNFLLAKSMVQYTSKS